MKVANPVLIFDLNCDAKSSFRLWNKLFVGYKVIVILVYFEVFCLGSD